jgi:hypothetical protein
MSRREFVKAVKVEIIRRATVNGAQVCEKCRSWPLKTFEIHHLRMDALEIDKSRRLTAADGALWCIPCHDEETAAQAPILARAKALEASHLGAKSAPAKKIESRNDLRSDKRKARDARGPRQSLPQRRLFR